jgi:hypothetical protein
VSFAASAAIRVRSTGLGSHANDATVFYTQSRAPASQLTNTTSKRQS